jgi:hypothetical protein
MSNSSFCDECGCYISPGREEILIGGGTFQTLCKRCYKQKQAVQDAITAKNNARGVTGKG